MANGYSYYGLGFIIKYTNHDLKLMCEGFVVKFLFYLWRWLEEVCSIMAMACKCLGI